MFSSVCSYSRMRALSWRLSLRRVWFSSDMAAFMRHPMVAGLDEVMDWPALRDPSNPAHERLWGMVRATWEGRGVVEGHAAGLRDLPTVNAFAAAGLASDHEMWTAEEAMAKLSAGLFVELRVHSLDGMVRGLLAMGLQDWSQVVIAYEPVWAIGASEPAGASGESRARKSASDT